MPTGHIGVTCCLCSQCVHNVPTGHMGPCPQCHPASRPIDFRVRAIGSQITADMSFDRTDPDHINNAADQLQTLVDSQLIDDQGRLVEVFDLLGNVRPELLRGNVGVDVTVGSGEPSPESSVHGSDQGESFAFGNNGSD